MAAGRVVRHLKGAQQRRPETQPEPARGPERAEHRLRLSADDLNLLRRATALAHHVCHLLVDAAGLRETRRAAFTLADELSAWHRRCEPELYGREAGIRP